MWAEQTAKWQVHLEPNEKDSNIPVFSFSTPDTSAIISQRESLQRSGDQRAIKRRLGDDFKENAVITGWWSVMESGTQPVKRLGQFKLLGYLNMGGIVEDNSLHPSFFAADRVGMRTTRMKSVGYLMNYTVMNSNITGCVHVRSEAGATDEHIDHGKHTKKKKT